MATLQDIHFDTVERKIYPRTFLITVFVVLNYNKVLEPNDVIARIPAFLKDYFNLEISPTEEEFNSGFAINGQNHSFLFSRGSLGVKSVGTNYVSFKETMTPLVYLLTSFLKNVLTITSLDCIKIRKVNILNAKEKDGILVSEDQLIKDFLSPELESRALPIDDDQELYNAHEFEGITDNNPFDIRFGFHQGKTPDGDRFVGLVLDETISKSSVMLDTLDEALIEINDIIFNMFHWSVNPNVLALMDKEL